MNKLLLLLSITFLLISDAFSQAKAVSKLDMIKANARKHFSETVNDYSSYKPVKWYPVKNIYSTYEEDTFFLDKALNIEAKILDTIKFYTDSSEYWLKEAEYRLNNARGRPKLDSLLNDSLHYVYLNKSIFHLRKAELEDNKLKTIKQRITQYQKELNNREKNFKPSLIGYKVNHTFRAKNGFGAYMIQHVSIYTNTKFKILSVDVINDDDD